MCNVIDEVTQNQCLPCSQEFFSGYTPPQFISLPKGEIVDELV